ncbi:hypothetical protein ACYZUD_21195 [Pseudomonas sp. XS1P51]
MSDLQDLTAAVGRNKTTISRVSRLEVRFEASGIESKRVYANGRMQVRVWIFVEAVDEDGDTVQLDFYPDLISARLIHYHNSEPLGHALYEGNPVAGWNASHFENRYAHEMPGGIPSGGTGGGSNGTPVERWVSSSVEGQAQIAAEVTVQGKVYRSNNTINPDGRKINKSVVIQAEKSTDYSREQFTWESHEIRGSFNSDLLFRYDLGLYPGGRQVKLLDWKSDQYGSSGTFPVTFCDTGLILGRDAPRSFMGVIVPSRATEVDVYVSGWHRLEVNQRSGELTVIKGTPPKYVRSEDVRVSPYFFTAIDEFGNTHDLSLEIDISNDEFILRRG